MLPIGHPRGVLATRGPLELLLPVFALAGLVWALVVLRRATPYGLSLTSLMLGVCAGPNLFHVSALSLDRAVFGLTLGVTGWAWRCGQLGPWRWQKSDLLVLAWIAWLTLSTLTHDVTWAGGVSVSTLLFYYLIPGATYVVARTTTWNASRWKVWWVSFAVLGVYLGLTAVAEVKQIHWAVFPRYIISPAYPEFLGRGRGPLINPVGNGLYLNAALLSCVVAAAGIRDRRTRILLSVAAVIALGGCYLTLTRSVWMGAGASLLVIAAVLVPGRWRLPALLGTLVVGLVLIATQWDRLTSFKRDQNVSVADMEQSAKLRPILATIAWKMFQESPWTGVGLGHYLEHNRQYTSERTGGLPLEKGRPYIQHNTALSLLTETGLIGLLLYVVVFANWGLAAWRRWRDTAAPIEDRSLGLVLLGLVTAYGVNSMFHELSVIPMVNMLMFLLAGLVCRPCYAHQSASGPSASSA